MEGDIQLTVNSFDIPGNATRREFAVYIVVAKRSDTNDFRLYVGKTGDNREGCNPVISRAGNHFSYNKVHSQVRNKLGAPTDQFDYKYFYVTFFTYDPADIDRTTKVDVTNEMERMANELLQEHLAYQFKDRLLNPRKGTGFVKQDERMKREQFRNQDRTQAVNNLVNAVLKYVTTIEPDAANQSLQETLLTSRP
jgi:hypothetical protein